jgi:Chaperone of endosialidase
MSRHHNDRGFGNGRSLLGVKKARRFTLHLSLFTLAAIAVVAMGLYMAVPAYSQTPKLIVKDSTGTNTVFSVDDTGTFSAVQGDMGDYATSTRSIRELNVIGSQGGLRLWRVSSLYPGAGVELMGSTPSAPDSLLSYWALFASTQYGPDMFMIRNARLNNKILFSITANGNVGIGMGNTPASHPFQVGTDNTNGNGAYLSAGGVWENGCSREFKENIKDLSAASAIETVNHLDPVTYAYKVDPSEKHVGFIAEDVPDLVATKDRKHLSALDIVAVLTKVVQEQQKTINELSQRLNKLQNEINSRGMLSLNQVR